MKGLTERQSEIVEFIRSFIQKKGYSPSYREIMKHFGFSSLATVSDHLKALQKKGLIEFLNHSRRSISLIDESPSENCGTTCCLSYIGMISSGEALELFHDAKSITVPARLVRNPESSYVIKAKGFSLQEELIDDGDLLIIEAKHDVDDGETALVSMGGLPFIKQIFFNGDTIELVSRNQNIDSITINQNLVKVQGVLAGLIRAY